MEDELWLEKIKDKLKDYSEPLLVAGWERLEKELSVSGTPIARPHKMIPFHRWAVATGSSVVGGSIVRQSVAVAEPDR